MGMQTVGDKLRQARVRKGLQVSDIEKEIGIESHLLLAMELDQFSLIPSDKVEVYVSSFAKIVGLSSEDVLAQYKEELSGQTKTTYDYANNSDVETSNLFLESSRGSRLDRRRKKKSFGFVKFLLMLALLLLVLSGAYYFYPKLSSYFTKSNQKPINLIEPKPEEEQLEEVDTTNSSIEEETPQTLISVEGEGNQLSAKVSTSQTPITVSFQLEGADSSWIALTNSDLGETGTLLTTDNPSYQTTLTEGTTTALLSLGVSKGVLVKINEELLDIAELVTGDVTTVNLEFQLESR